MPNDPALSAPNPVPDARRRTCFGFTLIELLVVMAIIVMLMSMLVPAFSSIGKSNALSMSGNQVVNLINLARSNSSSRNTMTAVVLNIDPNSEGAYRSFTIMERAAPEAGAVAKTTDWKQASKWEVLRTGVVVSSTSAFVLADSSKAPALDPPLPNLSYGGKTLNATNCQSVAFLPNGSLFSSKATRVTLVEGVYQGSTTISTNKGNYYNVTILPATGRTKIDRP